MANSISARCTKVEGFAATFFTATVYRTAHSVNLTVPPTGMGQHFLGFSIDSEMKSSPDYHFAFGTPYYYLVVLAAAVPGIRGIRSLRQRYQNTPGFCTSCGYDLRATPVRCPECGTEPNGLKT